MRQKIVTLCNIIIIQLFFQEIVFSQCNPQPTICNESKCGQVEIALAADANNVFCQGKNVKLSIDATKTSAMDSFIVYWCDGIVSRYKGDIFEFNHTYDVSEKDVCSKSSSDYFITVIGKKACGGGMSCRTTGVSLSVFHEPRAKFTFSNSICKEKTVTFDGSSSCNVDEAINTNFEWTFHDGTKKNGKSSSFKYTTPGQYLIKLKVFNQCGSNEITQVVNVVDLPLTKIDISLSAKDSVVCIGDEVTLIDNSNQWSRDINKWIFPSNNVLTDTLKWKLPKFIRDKEKRIPTDTIDRLDTIQFQVLQAGNYTFTLTATNDCGTSEVKFPLQVVQAPTLTIANPPAFCESAEYTPSAQVSGLVSDYNWTFPGGSPSSSNQKDPGKIVYNTPGVYDIKLTIKAACGELTRDTKITIFSKTPATITSRSPICQSSGSDTLKTNIPGGTWDGPGIIDKQKGIFNPSAVVPGKYNITYTSGPSECRAIASTEIEVLASAPVSVRDTTVCIDNSPITLFANPTGGTWAGKGITNNTFNPIDANVGSHQLTYSFKDQFNCSVQKNITATVESKPTISIPDTTLVCISTSNVNLNEILNLTSLQGGSYEYFINDQKVNEQLNLSSYTTSTQKLRVDYKKNQCSASDTGYLKFIEKPILSISKDTNVCINDGMLQLKTNITGKWSGPGIDDNGLIDLSKAQGGAKSYNFIYQKGTSCELTGTVNINVEDPATSLVAGPNEEKCFGENSHTFNGFAPIGGKWSGAGVSNQSSGEIDLTKLIPDSTYTYKYCFESSSFAKCEACATKQFVIRSLPKTNFAIDGKSCIGEAISIINNSSGFSNVEINYGDGTPITSNDFSHVYNSKGTYKLSIKLTNQFSCTNTFEKDLNVTTRPLAAFQIPTKSGCAPLPLTLINNSSGDDITEFKWKIAGKEYTESTPTGIVLNKVLKDSIFKITLAVTNGCGTVNAEDTVNVKPYPITDFGASDLQGCSPLKVEFSNTTIGNADSYRWDLGNGQSSVLTIPPMQVYTTSDSTISKYTVQLYAENECGNDTISKVITIYPPDVKAFIESPAMTICQFDSLRFDAFSTVGSINSWEIIDPTGLKSGASGNTTFVHFKKPGKHTIKLYASRCGTATDSSIIEVFPAPIVDFNLPDLVCMKDSLRLNNTSISLAKSEWNFGDGSTSAETNPLHIYKTPGTYTITLKGFSLVNNCEYSLSKNIKVVGLPKAQFTSNIKSGCLPLSIEFKNNSINATKFSWNFGDGTINNTSTIGSHTYNLAGTYKVSLKAIDDLGCFTDSSITNIIVHPLPTVKFAFEDKKYCFLYDSVKLINQSIGALDNEWTYDDKKSKLKQFNFLPSKTDLLTIRLKSTNEFGCIDSTTRSLNVLNSPTSLYEPNPATGCQNLNVTFMNKSTFADRYIWLFGNGNTSVNKDTSYAYQEAGKYRSGLIAMANNGCPSDTSYFDIVVHPKPIADFSFTKDSTCGVPMNVTFKNNSTQYKDSDWQINNLGVSQNNDFIYKFTAKGNYNINLLVENEFNCKDTTSKNIPIYLQPVANFSFKDMACEEEEITLQNLSLNAMSYEWSIQGKGMTTNEKPVIAYDKAGRYQVSLIAVYNSLCKDTFKSNVPITIFSKPNADFEYKASFDDKIIGEIQFKNLSSQSNSQRWNFGDGFFSTEENPFHEYNKNRAIIVSLIAYQNNNGLFTCIDSITKNIAPEWITTFHAPNALSPEYGEGLVKVFKPVGLGMRKYKITIYSPWGEAVWTSSEIDENGSPLGEWDGKYKEEIVPQGAYSWIAEITYVSGITEVKKGSVTVVR
jgi:PKD repeat protein